MGYDFHMHVLHRTMMGKYHVLTRLFKVMGLLTFLFVVLYTYMDL